MALNDIELRRVLEGSFDVGFEDRSGDSVWTDLEMSILFEGPPQIELSLEMTFNHIDFMLQNKQLASDKGFDFYCDEKTGEFVYNGYFFHRYTLVFKEYNRQRVHDFILTLVNKCRLANSNFFELLTEYAYDPAVERSINFSNDSWGVAAQNPLPRYSWNFIDTLTIDPNVKIFDERIAIDITWLNDGKENYFRGYWYIASVDFFKKKVELADPYYRRYTIACGSFMPEYIDEELSRVMSYLATKPMDLRYECLKYHFEYDGQEMFYER